MKNVFSTTDANQQAHATRRRAPGGCDNTRGHCPGGHFSRRDFLRVGSLPFLGIGLSEFLRAREALGAAAVDAKATAQSCIMVWLDGGAPQMDTFDPKPSSSFKAIPTNVSGIQYCELLPKLAQRADKLSIIRSVRSPENNHGGATLYAATGHAPNPAMKFPGVGAIVAKETGARGAIPPYVIAPEMPKGKEYDEYMKAHFVGPEYDPLILPFPRESDFQVPDLELPKELSIETVNRRRSFLDLVDRHYREKVESAEFQSMDSFLDQAWSMILSPAVREAFDIGKESDKTRERYGKDDDAFGKSLLLARRLVEAGSRFVTAGGFGPQAWDTHQQNDTNMKSNLAPRFDQGLSALLDDLDERGLLDSTVVLVIGEFGRTAHLNVKFGRDHWPECWSVAITGGGIRPGRTVGESDERAAYVADRPISIGDIYATIYKAMGIDWHKEYMHPIGRPIKIANGFDDKTGQPVDELF